MKGKLDIKCLVRSARGFIIVAKGILGNYTTFFFLLEKQKVCKDVHHHWSEENSANFMQLTLRPLKSVIHRENFEI